MSTAVNHNAAGAVFTDWRLPTKNELNLLYAQKTVVGGFALGNTYWSATENASSVAWYQTFASGTQANNGKTSSYRVRAVRAF